jgi:nitroreductase
MEDLISLARPLIHTRQHRSFTSEPVAEAYLNALTEVARWSGSSANSQPWRFIVVRDVDLIRQIGTLGMPSTRSLQTAMAAIAIALPDDEKRQVSRAFDEGRAAERMLIAGTLLEIGTGIAWIPKEGRAQVGQLLGLPEDWFVRTIMAVGHLSADERAPKAAPGTARLPRQETVRDGHF